MATIPNGVTTLSSGASGPLDSGADRSFQGEGADIATNDHPLAFAREGYRKFHGGIGDDVVIVGDTGSDLLIGGTGNDVIDAGSGHDVMTGGTGHDVFVITTGDGHDVITDFATGDILEIAHDVDGLNVIAPNDLVPLISTDPSGNAVIFLGAEHSITLLGVNADELIRHIDDYIRII